MTLDNINELMHQALEPVSQRWPGRLTIEELHASVPGYECPTDHRMVAVIEELLGTRTQVVNYCTEAPFVQQVCPTPCSAPVPSIRPTSRTNTSTPRLSNRRANCWASWSITFAGNKPDI